MPHAARASAATASARSSRLAIGCRKRMSDAGLGSGACARRSKAYCEHMFVSVTLLGMDAAEPQRALLATLLEAHPKLLEADDLLASHAHLRHPDAALRVL